ncbi:CHRD domain-containing protein [Piscinibacter sp.]|jgi:hypothetical protein|uniref:CHRD domain-containing protein n=1 Tax=Piscinibacter sp. TaxID=1903157 RepID=UPI00355A6782
MRISFRIQRPALSIIAAAALALAAGVASAQQVNLTLSGDSEVPPVKTAAAGSGAITVAADKSVSGAVATTGVAGTMAHIHEAAAGKNGGVIIPLKQEGDKWVVPAGAKLTDAQFEAFKAGNLYVNVHSAANPGGEVRAQIKP